MRLAAANDVDAQLIGFVSDGHGPASASLAREAVTTGHSED
jgi:hypothetical protein